MKTLLLSLLALTLSTPAFAANPETNDGAYQIPRVEKMDIGPRHFLEIPGRQGQHSQNLAKVRYDYAVYGGATTTVFSTPVWLPRQTVINRTFVESVTPLTVSSGSSLTAQVYCASSTTPEILNSSSVLTALGTAGNLLEGVATGATTVMTNMANTSPCQVKINFTCGACNGVTVTAGKFDVFIQYVQTD